MKSVYFAMGGLLCLLENSNDKVAFQCTQQSVKVLLGYVFENLYLPPEFISRKSQQEHTLVLVA